MKIAVFGGTGLVGSPIVGALLGRGKSVRVVSRNADRAARHFGPAQEVAEADAESGLGLDDALDGCSGVVLSIDNPREGECVGRVVEAAARSGAVQRVLYVSGCTAVEENAWFPLTAGKLKAEAYLRDGGVDWTVLAPGWFFETLARFVRGGKAVLIGRDPNRYHFVAAGDFARIAARVFEEPGARNRRFVVHGPEAFTLRDALNLYCRARHPEIRKISNPPTWLLRAMARLSRNQRLQYALELMAYFERVGELGDPGETNRLFGAPETTLAAWLRHPA